MQPHNHTQANNVPSPAQIVRELWRRVQMTNDHKEAFKGIEQIAAWLKIMEAERAAQKPSTETAE